jgi:hypothetical protein
MLNELLTQLPSLGIAGVLFVMWWIERNERTAGTGALRDALQQIGQVADVNANLLGVVQANTEALTALREELRSHRAGEVEWLTRLNRQLDELG